MVAGRIAGPRSRAHATAASWVVCGPRWNLISTKSTCRRMVAMSKMRDRVRQRMGRQWEGRAGQLREVVAAGRAEACGATETSAAEAATHAGLFSMSGKNAHAAGALRAVGRSKEQVELTLRIVWRAGSPERLPSRSIKRRRHGRCYPMVRMGRVERWRRWRRR